MKKLVLMFLVVCMVAVVPSVMAAGRSSSVSTTFDVSKLEGEDGYEYDAFEGEWSYYKAYVEKYSDARVVIGLQISGDDEGVMPLSLYAWIRDQTNQKTIREITGISVMIGSNVYRFANVVPGDTSSGVLIGSQGREFVQALADASSITVRLSFSTGSIDIEIKGSDYRTTIKQAAQTIIRTNALDAYDESEWGAIVDLMMYTKR